MIEKGVINSINFSQYLGPHLKLNLVFPGDIISSEKGFMHGQGTVQDGDKIVATTIGKVDKTEKLIMVTPLNKRYSGEVGDIVVGRVAEVTVKRWKIDVNSFFFATLHLNSINLPSGVQRRKTYEDEQSMREIFKENDLIVAEVHSRNEDGSLNLQTRNLKYGKLEQGYLIKVHAKLVKRQRSHYVDCNFGVTIIMGMNGCVWVTRLKKEIKGDKLETELNTEIDIFERMAKINNIIQLLNKEYCDITIDNIISFYQVACSSGIQAKKILDNQYNQTLLSLIKEKIEKKIPAEIAKLSRSGNIMSDDQQK